MARMSPAMKRQQQKMKVCAPKCKGRGQAHYRSCMKSCLRKK